MLLQNNANPNIQPYDKERYAPPIHNAVYFNSPEMCELLLSFGTNINSLFDGETPLQFATRMKYGKVIKVLQDATDKKKEEQKVAAVSSSESSPSTHSPPKLKMGFLNAKPKLKMKVGHQGINSKTEATADPAVAEESKVDYKLPPRSTTTAKEEKLDVKCPPPNTERLLIPPPSAEEIAAAADLLADETAAEER